MNVLLIGFKYHEIENIQDILVTEFPQFNINFAISVRDSWYRLKISFYDLIILDATCSDTDSLVTYQEISVRSEGIPIILIATENEIKKISQLSEDRPQFTIIKENKYLDKLITMLKKGEQSKADLDLQYQFRLKEDKQRLLQYFHISINTILDPLFIVNNKFEIIEANNPLLEEFQITRREVIGKSCYEIIHGLTKPCNGNNWTCPLKEVLELGVPYQGTINQLQQGTNNPQKLSIKANPIRNELNQVEEVVVTLRKEPQLPQTQTYAIFNRSLLELMLSGLSDGLLFCNSDNKILLLNQAAETILGKPKAKLIDQSIFNLPLGDGSGWLIEVLNGVNSNLRFNSLAFKTRINSHFVQIRFAPIFGENNYYLGGFLYLTEVEESAKHEKAESQFILNEKIFDILHLTSPKIIAEG